MSGGSLVFIVLGVVALVALVIAGVSLMRRRGGAGGGLPSRSSSGTSAPSAPSARPSAPLDSPKTMMMEMPGSGAAPVAGGTVSMQWYGLLHCTSGELEGERFFIEDEGFYIGRDPGLSKVVVDDSRVSKRHVRIMTRDGKVVAIDQDSTNGTYLNKVGSARITEVILKKGDVLILADDAASFKYQI